MGLYSVAHDIVVELPSSSEGDAGRAMTEYMTARNASILFFPSPVQVKPGLWSVRVVADIAFDATSFDDSLTKAGAGYETVPTGWTVKSINQARAQDLSLVAVAADDTKVI